MNKNMQLIERWDSNESIKLAEVWDEFKSDKERWLFVFDNRLNTNMPPVIIDHGETYIWFGKDGAYRNGELLKHFDNWAGSTDGFISLLEGLGIKIEDNR